VNIFRDMCFFGGLGVHSNIGFICHLVLRPAYACGIAAGSHQSVCCSNLSRAIQTVNEFIRWRCYELVWHQPDAAVTAPACQSHIFEWICWADVER